MPIAGGTASKLGLRYELTWTVDVLAAILAERAQLIRLEPPLPEGEGIEFWLEQDGIRQYHQVKRQTTERTWTLAHLQREGVLGAAWKHLQDATATFFFVSRDSAEELADLVERAKPASDLDEFRRGFAADQATSRGFARAHAAFSAAAAAAVGEEETLDVLKRISVRTMDEESLATAVANRLEMLVDGEPTAVAAVLQDVALGRVNERLDAVTLWTELTRAGFQRRGWMGDSSTLALVEQVNAGYLTELQTETLLDPIVRTESNEILYQLAFGSRRTVLAVGGAGVGKSGVLLQVADVLARDEIPFLAFRMDRQVPTDSPRRLGEQLGLAGSPVNVLAAVANERPCVLIVDQLDAVSSASGRAPEFFACLAQLIAQAEGHSEMRVLLSCRRVDADNDPRLRALTAGEDAPANRMEIHPLDEQTIRRVVGQLGIDGAALTPRQLELLAYPLNLTLLAQTAASHQGGAALDFDTAANLYERWWDFKQDQLNRELGGRVEFVPVVNTLVDHMSATQQLSAPKAVVDMWRQDARAMAGANVLIETTSRYAFVHEGFFDFVFARQFVARGLSLADLLQGEQHLFRRAQVRQVLQYLRDVDSVRYLNTLRELLLPRSVRLHLKEATFAVLAGISAPSREERDVVVRVMETGTDAEKRLAWRPARSAAWFAVIDEEGLVTRWLAGADDEARYQALLLLGEAQRDHPDRVAELLAPYVDDPNWDQAFLLVARASFGNSRALLDLYLRLLASGRLTESSHEIWFLLKTIQDQDATWGVEALVAFLRSRIAIDASENGDPFGRIEDRGTYSYEIVTSLATAVPQPFAESMLPFVLDVGSARAFREGAPPFPDSVWETRIDGSTELDDAVVHGLNDALRILAVEESETLQALFSLLRESDLQVGYFLLLSAYCAVPERYADEALALVNDMPQLLAIEKLSDGRGVIRELLDAATPYASDETYARLEALLLNYYPDWERRPGAGEYFGATQFSLLRRLSAYRLSEKAKGQLAMLERKFGNSEDEFERATRVGAVRAPIPGDATERMTDAQWLSAMRRYTRDGLHIREGAMVGGLHEVAQSLQRQTVADPARFVALANQMDDALPYSYFRAIASGVLELEPALEFIEPLVARLHRLDGTPGGSDIARLVRHGASEPISWEAIELMLGYARPDTSTPASDIRGSASGPAVSGSGVAVQEAVMHALAALIYFGYDRVERLVPLLAEMATEQEPALRAAFAEPLSYLLAAERDMAVRIFLELADASDDSFFRDRRVDAFLGYALQTHASELRPVIERMMRSADEHVVGLGAQAAMFGRRFSESTQDLADRAILGRDQERLGAVTVLANQLHWWPDDDYASSSLAQAFDDQVPEVRKAAAHCFIRLKEGDLNRFSGLVGRFIESEAFSTDSSCLMHALKDTTERLPEISLDVCERFLSRFGPEAGDIRTARAGDGAALAEIVFRVYSQAVAVDERLAKRCLDLVDGMISVGLYRVDSSLLLFER